MKNVNSAAALLACVATAMGPTQAQAQAAQPWIFDVAVYGWFPSISGSTSFPSGNSGPSFDLSAEHVIDSLKFALMGAVQATKGPWGVWSDFVYADFGGSKLGSREFNIDGQPAPVGVDGQLVLDVKSTIWSLAGTYTVSSAPEHRTDVLLGTRMLDMRQTFSWSLMGDLGTPPVIDRAGAAQVDITNWDAIVGIKGQTFFDIERRWYVPYYLDVGTGQSKFTWQFNVGVGYRFDWGSTVLSWRYLDYKMKSGNPIEDLNMNGLLLGAVFQF